MWYVSAYHAVVWYVRTLSNFYSLLPVPAVFQGSMLSGYCLCFKYSPLILLSTRNILAVGTAYNSNTRRIYDFILRGAVVLAVFQGFILRGTAGTSLTRGVLLE